MKLPKLKDRPPLMRDENPVWLGAKELLPGDIFLSTGEIKSHKDWPTWIVRVLDNSGYSHIGFFDGTHVFEVGLHAGVVATPLVGSVQRNKYIDVYRFHSDDGNKIGDPDWPLQPLRDCAGKYIGLTYGSSDAVLAAILMIIRKSIKAPRGMALVFRTVLHQAVKFVQDHVSKTPANKILTCSEYIYRIFYEALPQKQYRLKIDASNYQARNLIEEFDLLGSKSDVEIPMERALTFVSTDHQAMNADADEQSDEVVEILELAARFAEEYETAKSGDSLQVSANDMRMFGSGVVGFSRSPVADYVSPRDIATSCNVTEMGRIDKNLFPKPALHPFRKLIRRLFS